MYDVVIIGSGPAGLTAAIYTCRAKLKTLVLEGNIPGGNAGITDLIENYPGFPQGINGSELMSNFMQQAESFGAEIVYEAAKDIQVEGEIKRVITDQGEYPCRAVIITSGARRRELEVEGEYEFMGKGVSYCATCDGAFYKDTPVAIVGGGDSAVKEALYLADIASKVYLIHRREGFRANQTTLDKMYQDSRIELKLNKVVVRIEGDETSVKSIVLKDMHTGEEEILETSGVFVSIGMIPASDYIVEKLDCDNAYIITDDKMMTSAPGIFAAGDIRSKNVRQVATAVGDGAVAGVSVTEYLKE